MEMTPEQAVIAEAERIVIKRQNRDAKIGLALMASIYLAKRIAMRALINHYRRNLYR